MVGDICFYKLLDNLRWFENRLNNNTAQSGSGCKFRLQDVKDCKEQKVGCCPVSWGLETKGGCGELEEMTDSYETT